MNIASKANNIRETAPNKTVLLCLFFPFPLFNRTAEPYAVHNYFFFSSKPEKA
jgi:hypothetical protein